MMDRYLINDVENGIEVRVSEFRPAASDTAAKEYCAMLTSTRQGRRFDEEIEALLNACATLRHKLGENVKPVFKRYFLSDPANQSPLLPADTECAVSVIGQSPLDGSRAAVWIYLVEGAEVTGLHNGFYRVNHGDFTHYWQGGAHIAGADSETATRRLLDDYSRIMSEHGCALGRDCARTWFFVRDVDVNYAGFVRGRNAVFAENGLTSDTHFIASTGICGSGVDRTVTVTMDTYTVKGLQSGQMRYLYAPTHLNPTYEYGVAFERGTAIDYADRRHVLISGTASIDNRGNVVHPGDIVRQTLRMWENVETLLQEAGCGYDDVMHMIVYLRDIADFRTVDHMFRQRFPDTPRVIVLAPVCRPEWLVEMECMAIRPAVTGFGAF